MYTTILFDFDGTLTPSLELWLQAYHYALTECKMELTEEGILEKCYFRDFDEVATDLGILPEAEFGRHVETGLAQAFAEAQLFPMVLELLQGCKQAGLATAIVTTSSGKQISTALKHLGITEYFDTVVSASDVTKFKPDPEPVQLALSRLEKSPDETLFVGDFTADILAGRAAGTRTALFMPEQHARFYNFETLRATQPDFVFTHHQELIEHLQLPVLN